MDRATKGDPYVLHVSGDFPDPIQGAKTPVIRTLLALTSERFDHSVLSINRVSPGVAEALTTIRAGRLRVESEPFEQGDAVRYFAPPFGLLHAAALKQLASWLAMRIASLPRRPDLLVGHKLTIEGIVVAQAAAELGIPYALSIQGDTDTKILSARPDLTGLFRQVLHGASFVFPFTPWAWQKIVAKLGPPPCGNALLPCPTDLDEPLAPVPGGDGLISVFHLGNYRRKNLAGMVRALEGWDADEESPRLTIVGGGDTKHREECERIVAGCRHIELAGPLGRADVQKRLNKATALVLPSLRESFGLVFIEALFAGAPVIYPAGTAIDGYFSGFPFAIAVNARNPKAIASAMRTVLQREAELKAALADWQRSSHAEKFKRPNIARQFSNGLDVALGRAALAQLQ